jgi:hypothetical protein
MFMLFVLIIKGAVLLIDPLAAIGYVTAGLLANRVSQAFTFGGGWGILISLLTFAMAVSEVRRTGHTVSFNPGLIFGYAVLYGGASTAIFLIARSIRDGKKSPDSNAKPPHDGLP